MFFHKLRGLPIAQLAFGRCGAPFGFGCFSGKLFQLFLAVNHRLRMRRGMRMQRSAFVWMGECPFERSVNNQVRIAPDRRSEMRVLIEAKREMSQRIRG